MIERRIAAGDLAGAVTIVARRGKVAHLAAQGVMDLDTKQPMTPASMFRIASMTKPVVGVSIMMLVEEDKLRLNDPVARYIPEFANMKVAVARPGERRQRGPELLHRAGAAADHHQGSAHARVRPRQRPDEQQRHRQGGAQGRRDAGPDTSRAWAAPRSSSSPARAGPTAPAPASRRSAASSRSRRGLPLDRFFQTRVFDPLGMRDITFWPTDAQWPRVATVYQPPRRRV